MFRVSRVQGLGCLGFRVFRVWAFWGYCFGINVSGGRSLRPETQRLWCLPHHCFTKGLGPVIDGELIYLRFGSRSAGSGKKATFGPSRQTV